MKTMSPQPWSSLPVFDAALFEELLRANGPALLFALRLWISVCLAFYVAFWLELDNPFWAGTTAAIVCQPQLGASLRKGWFRMVGTLVGAIMAVVITACFPQDRIAFLTALALWCAICAFAATVLRNFTSYAAALAGFTTAVISADSLGATGGPNSEVFMLAITRASEICIGIVCAGVILAGTDLGGARRRLAASFAELAGEITLRFNEMLALQGTQVSEMRPQRRALLGRIIALEPAIDQAIGESSQLRYRSPVLQMAVQGLFNALDGWRGTEAHLKRLTHANARQRAETIRRTLPLEMRRVSVSSEPAPWMADPIGTQKSFEEARQRLLALPASTPSHRLLVEQTTKLLSGILHVLDGLALLVDAPSPQLPAFRGFRLAVPDWLPAFINAGRAFAAISGVVFFWIVTAWPNGALAFTFTAVVILLLSPSGDRAYASALAFIFGIIGSIICTAFIKFAVLPRLETFPAFCIVLGLYLVPVGFGMARSRQPAVLTMITAMTVFFIPLLDPTNEMTYDTAQFYNTALTLLVGCGAAALSFRLLPPLSPALRSARLLALALRDMRQLAADPLQPSLARWESIMHNRLAVLPDTAEPWQRAQLLAALSVGVEIIQLRQMCAVLALGPELARALTALAQGDGSRAGTQLARLDRRLADLPDTSSNKHLELGARAAILAISESLAEHHSYFDGRAPL